MDVKPNADLREYIKSSGAKTYQIYGALGWAAITYYRKLNSVLPSLEKQRIMQLADALGSRGDMQKARAMDAVINRLQADLKGWEGNG